jgi:hypothetical protein
MLLWPGYIDGAHRKIVTCCQVLLFSGIFSYGFAFRGQSRRGYCKAFCQVSVTVAHLNDEPGCLPLDIAEMVAKTVVFRLMYFVKGMREAK